MMLHSAIVAASAIAVALLLAGIRSGAGPTTWAAKSVASALFVISGALRLDGGDPIGATMLAALVLCAIGDVLLLGRRTFDPGLAAFLLGHAAFVTAFAMVVPIAAWPTLPLAILAPAGLAVAAWLWPHLGRRRGPVMAYIAVISAMVWGALAVARVGAGPWTMAAGALLFFLSDLAVARQRFVRSAFVNRAIGLPLYYAGQLLLAASIGAVH